jgi:hypothetical protein
MRLVVTINGTGTNPWHRLNLRQNPFPQIAKSEFLDAMVQLNSLDADPISPANVDEEIDRRLSGWTEEFRSLCKKMYEPGQQVRFTVTFELQA